MNAGPAVKADARNRGPSSAVCQKGRAGSPASRNAVTRWMLTAHITEIYIHGRYFFLAGARPA
jgi:hypothetical protein